MLNPIIQFHFCFNLEITLCFDDLCKGRLCGPEKNEIALITLIIPSNERYTFIDNKKYKY